MAPVAPVPAGTDTPPLVVVLVPTPVLMPPTLTVTPVPVAAEPLGDDDPDDEPADEDEELDDDELCVAHPAIIATIQTTTANALKCGLRSLNTDCNCTT
jgi:hypothetical protein